MRRTIYWIIVLLAIGFLLFFLRTNLLFTVISGRSMEPELNFGDLVLIKQALSSKVKEGDIIVFEPPALVSEHYSYPRRIVHRVLEAKQRNGELIFRTKGDNSGIDPFIVRTIDLKGVIGKKIPYLGFLLLFLQSKQGLISIIIILLLIGLGTYSPEINQLKRRAQRDIFSPVLEEQQETKRALTEFASAMTEYARHLASHTKAVQNLAEAAEKLKKVVEKLDQKLNKEDESIKKSG